MEEQAAAHKVEMEDRKYEDGRAEEATNKLVSELTARVNALSSEVKEVRGEHIHCVEQQGYLKGQIAILLEKDAKKGELIAKLTEEVNRLSRHEQANMENLKNLTAIAEQTKDAPPNQ